jgi:hypothetical protein
MYLTPEMNYHYIKDVVYFGVSDIGSYKAYMLTFLFMIILGGNLHQCFDLQLFRGYLNDQVV